MEGFHLIFKVLHGTTDGIKESLFLRKWRTFEKKNLYQLKTTFCRKVLFFMEPFMALMNLYF